MKLIAILLVLVLLFAACSTNAEHVGADANPPEVETTMEMTTITEATTAPFVPHEAFIAYLHETLVPRHGLDHIHSVFFDGEQMIVISGEIGAIMLEITIYTLSDNNVTQIQSYHVGSWRGEKYGPIAEVSHVFLWEMNDNRGIGIESRTKYDHLAWYLGVDKHIEIDHRLRLGDDVFETIYVNEPNAWNNVESKISQRLPSARITSIFERNNWVVTDHTNWQLPLTEEFYTINLRFPREFGWTIMHGRACWQTGEGMTAAVGTPISIGVSFRDTGAPRRLMRWALEPAANFSNRTEGEIHWIDFIMPAHDVVVVMYIELL